MLYQALPRARNSPATVTDKPGSKRKKTYMETGQGRPLALLSARKSGLAIQVEPLLRPSFEHNVK